MKNYCTAFSIFLILLSFSACNRSAGNLSSNSNEVSKDDGTEIEKDADLTTFFLVRHAEKIKEVKNPGLTDKGIKRAQDLADFLKEEKLGAIYSTDYNRTKLTAKVAALEQNLTVKNYNKIDEAFVNQLMKEHQGQSVLIVGHSNTTPDLANLLTGTSDLSHYKESEYNKMLIISLKKIGDANVISLTYGDANR